MPRQFRYPYSDSRFPDQPLFIIAIPHIRKFKGEIPFCFQHAASKNAEVSQLESRLQIKSGRIHLLSEQAAFLVSNKIVNVPEPDPEGRMASLEIIWLQVLCCFGCRIPGIIPEDHS